MQNAKIEVVTRPKCKHHKETHWLTIKLENGKLTNLQITKTEAGILKKLDTPSRTM